MRNEPLTDTGERWPIGNQVQHDTNLAAQDVEQAAARLRRLTHRMHREHVEDARAAAVLALLHRMQALVTDLYNTK